MFKLTGMQKCKLERLVKEKGLIFVVIFGSQIKGRINKDSDLDVAVLDKQKERLGRFGEICGGIQDILGYENLDLVFLNKADALLKFEVLTKGRFLCGDYLAFCQSRSLAFRDYLEKRDLVKLQGILIRKRHQRLKELINA